MGIDHITTTVYHHPDHWKSENVEHNNHRSLLASRRRASEEWDQFGPFCHHLCTHLVHRYKDRQARHHSAWYGPVSHRNPHRKRSQRDTRQNDETATKRIVCIRFLHPLTSYASKCTQILRPSRPAMGSSLEELSDLSCNYAQDSTASLTNIQYKCLYQHALEMQCWIDYCRKCPVSLKRYTYHWIASQWMRMLPPVTSPKTSWCFPSTMQKQWRDLPRQRFANYKSLQKRRQNRQKCPSHTTEYPNEMHSYTFRN